MNGALHEPLTRLAGMLNLSRAAVLVAACHALILRSQGCIGIVALKVISTEAGQVSTLNGRSAPSASEQTSFMGLARLVQAELDKLPLRRDLLESWLFTTKPEAPNPASSPTPEARLALADESGEIMLMAEGAGTLSLPPAYPGAETLPRVLDAAVNHLRDPLSHLPLLANPEHILRIRQWNATEHSPLALAEPTIHALVAAHATSTPTAIAVEDAHFSLSYAQLNSEADRLQRLLREQGVAPGSVVAVAVARDWRLPTAVLAVLKAGAAAFILDPDASSSAWPSGHGAVTLLADRASAERVLPPIAARSCKVLLLEDLAGQVPAPSPVVLAGPLAALVNSGAFTPAPIRHDTLLNFLQAARTEFALSATDRLLSLVPLGFAGIWLDLFLPLLCGGTLLLASPERLRTASICQATPSLWRQLLRTGWDGVSDTPLRILCSGEAVDAALAAELLVRGHGRFWNLYGTATTGIWSLCECVTECVALAGSPAIGRPVANTNAYVLDPEGRLLPPGLLGELWIGGIGAMDAPRSRPDPFAPSRPIVATGDRARWLPDGRLSWEGRMNDPWHLEAVEAALMLHPDIDQAGCRIDEATSNQVVACLQLMPDTASPTPAALRDHLQSRLPGIVPPARFVLVNTIPLTAQGRLDRKALPAQSPALPETLPVRVGSENEAILIRFYKQVMETTSISRDDDFFARGGQPMQAIQLLALLQEQFNVALHLDALTYLGPTPARLAILVSEANERSAFSPVMPLQPGAESSRIPLFCMPMLGAASLFPYRRLAQHLHGVVPMMGLLPPGRDGRTPAPRSMQELALYGIDALRHHQPHGPYRLCGLLSAGLMAYEMACLLTLQGETVAGVVLVDTRLPSSAMQFLARLGVAGPRIMDGVALTHSVLPAPIQQLYRRLRVAGRSYRPSVFEDPILLVTASQSVQRLGDPTLGWKRYCPQLETIELSSRHDDLPHEPAAEQLGQILTTHLFSA